MAGCISSGSGADISALNIANDNKALLLAVFNRLVISLQSFNSKLLIHGDLRFYRRYQIRRRVYNLLIKQPDGLRRPFKSLAELIVRFLRHMLRNIAQHRIQPHTNRSLRLLYFFN